MLYRVNRQARWKLLYTNRMPQMLAPMCWCTSKGVGRWAWPILLRLCGTLAFAGPWP